VTFLHTAPSSTPRFCDSLVQTIFACLLFDLPDPLDPSRQSGDVMCYSLYTQMIRDYQIEFQLVYVKALMPVCVGGPPGGGGGGGFPRFYLAAPIFPDSSPSRERDSRFCSHVTR
jgi:hypothetical protein